MRSKGFGVSRLLCAALLGVAATSGSVQAGGLEVRDGWIRALPPNVSSGGYFTLINHSGQRVVLTGASSPACGMLMLHQTETGGGMASMSDVPSVPVAAGARLSFAPGGYHLMCMDPTAAIKPGNVVDVTLEFADGAKVTAGFKVRSATGE